jgi:peptidoglycan hydrolase-like protein with peptidoglycan-binding domain
VPPALFERTFQWPQYGCKREARVYRLQYMLKSLGYKVGTDKYFGKDTKEAVQKFQADMGLEADGVAGPSTIKTLINKYGVVEYYKEFCL